MRFPTAIYVGWVLARIQGDWLEVFGKWAMLPEFLFWIGLNYLVILPSILCWCDWQCWIVVALEPVNDLEAL
jgi:hypothetical protein